MTRSLAILAPFLLVSLAQAATVNTTLTVNNAPVSITGTSASVSGTATLSNIGSGAFTATGSIGTGSNVTAPFTIQLSERGLHHRVTKHSIDGSGRRRSAASSTGSRSKWCW